ncbi:2-hydroxyacid dehydrogenase [Desulfosporosinus shakirovi]|uniref:2-hydroxyacid dehydrogenase n=1 Tax=Desulfosporosinus shakirovi TaxID=2885154 RepID=UPI001E4A6A42|nr:2-hydroxyacid dehydrogenase [Desulfosporosinus sp. SRJS8]MCB8814817.1 2-hydroxyacid dehydrogenase [Desulfosporosinus sp. SRJS8]
MKIIIFVDPNRIEKYKQYCDIPENLELIYLSQSTSDAEVLECAKNADFIFADAIKEISGYLIPNMPNLKLIHSEGVGFNRIDIEAAKRNGIYVCNNPGVNSGAVAEQTIMLMLGLQRKLIWGDHMVRTGKQIEAKESQILEGITELGDCHVGLIGFGAIAKETAKRLISFGTKVSYYSRRRDSQEMEQEYNVEYMPLEELISKCDIISLHVPVTDETKEMVNKDFLNRMKQSALLINTSRGELVDQEALKESLIQGKIAGAGLDTLTPEPVTLENPLLTLQPEAKGRVIFSPHIGGTTEGAFRKMHQGVWNNVRRVINGQKPVNIVNGS